MARYIDADKFMETIKKKQIIMTPIYAPDKYRMSMEEIEQMISEQPALDTNIRVECEDVVGRAEVIDLINTMLKDSWKDYDPRVGRFAVGLAEKIEQMDGPLDQSLRAAELAQIEKPHIYPMEPIKLEDISEANYIDHLIDDMMEKWRENGGKLNIVFTYGGKEIE